MDKNLISQIGGEMKDTADNLLEEATAPLKSTVSEVKGFLGLSSVDEDEQDDEQQED